MSDGDGDVGWGWGCRCRVGWGWAVHSRMRRAKVGTPYRCLCAAPKLIIYDNACNLQRYALRREPAYFAHTWFAIDRTHQKGHSA